MDNDEAVDHRPDHRPKRDLTTGRAPTREPRT